MRHAKTLLATAIVALLATSAPAFADDDGGWLGTKWLRRADVKPVANEQYTQECGSCHMAYQPGLLPARSWERMMSSLDDHFGENAELADDVHNNLLAYLKQNAAETSNYKRSRRIMSSLRPTDAPLRISETPYLKGKHREIPAGALGANAQVKSISQCQACHTRAEKGSFSEREILIPGFGRWED